MKRFIWMLILSVIVISCKPGKEIIKTEYRDVYKTKIDSVYLYEKDSIFIRQKGDTVFSDRFKLVYKDKIKLVRDSIFINKTDTVVKKIKETKIKTEYKYDAVWRFGILSIIYFIIKLILFFRRII